jgi:TonB family protein
LGVLEECIKDLRKDYLIDQNILDRVAVEAKVIDLGFGTNDYPSEALRANAQADVGTLLWVGAKGRVSDCTVVESSGVESLDTATCMIFRRRTRYDPARDAQGNAMRAPTYYRLK